MVGGKIIEIFQIGNKVRIKCVDTTYAWDECYVEAENSKLLPSVGDSIWWQCGKIYFNNDKNTLKKVGYSYST